MLMRTKSLLKIFLLTIILGQNLNLLRAEHEENNIQLQANDESEEAQLIKKSSEIPSLDDIEKLIERNDDGEVISHIYYSTLLFANHSKYLDQIKRVIERLKQKQAQEYKSINFPALIKAAATGVSSLFLGYFAFGFYQDKNSNVLTTVKKNIIIGSLAFCSLLSFVCAISELKKLYSDERYTQPLKQAYAIKLALIDLKRILNKDKEKKQEEITPALPVSNASKYGRASK